MRVTVVERSTAWRGIPLIVMSVIAVIALEFSLLLYFTPVSAGRGDDSASNYGFTPTRCTI